ncbi:MAG: PEP/pyruvate-binding domain-containing protein, partial [Candidatus Thorarchaeota archaeon]
IPNGFVIPVDVFKQFLKSSKDSESFKILTQSSEDLESLLSSAEIFREAMLRSEIPFTIAQAIKAGFQQLTTQLQGKIFCYAVRSSASIEDTAQLTFAGQADTFLCVPDQSSVLEAVKKTWLSLYSPRALLYLQEKGIPIEHVHMGVIVQEMILGDISGVMFTSNIVTNDPAQLLVDATWGLGESIVSGKVTPDSFILQKEPLKIIKRRKGDKALYSAPYPADKPKCTHYLETPPAKRNKLTLNDSQLLELARLGLEIEEKMNHPQDIEWTYKDGRFVILQTRPITTF